VELEETPDLTEENLNEEFEGRNNDKKIDRYSKKLSGHPNKAAPVHEILFFPTYSPFIP
jgi:hypothetical protein